jgi:hypothetical protein
MEPNARRSPGRLVVIAVVVIAVLTVIGILYAVSRDGDDGFDRPDAAPALVRPASAGV